MPPSLETSGYVVVERFLDVRIATAFYLMFQLRRHRGETRRDEQVPAAQSFWGDSTLDALLIALLPDVERVAGQRLLPTYCYGRLYAHGDELRRHVDRPSAEVVVSLHLGYRGTPPPPLCFGTKDGAALGSVAQRPGDAVVFRGTQLAHWRAPFAGEDFGQVFCNYVRADGAHRGNAFDGRHSQFPPLLHDLVGA